MRHNQDELVKMSNICKQVFVSGKVQGVYYRANTVEQAKINGIKGWVKNLPDGRVEAHIEGSCHAIDSILQWMHHGPEHAEVDDIVVLDITPSGYTNFVIL